MTVGTEAAYAEQLWTGAQASFTPGFTASAVDDVVVRYLDAQGLPQSLIRGVHFNTALDGAGNVKVTPIALPSASVPAPVTLIFQRNTQAVQGTDFQNLHRYSATVHGALFDRAFRALGEIKAALARSVGPFFTTANVVDFRPRRIKAAEPIDNADVATMSWVLTVTGLIDIANSVAAAAASASAAVASAALALVRQQGAETARDKSQAWSDTAENTNVPGTVEFSSYHWSRKAQAYAATVLSLFNNPDDGIFGDVESGPIDDGVF